MDLDTEIDVETNHISDNGRPQRYPGLQQKIFFFRGSEKKREKRIANIIVDMKQGWLLKN